jgi:hypothetical protein
MSPSRRIRLAIAAGVAAATAYGAMAQADPVRTIDGVKVKFLNLAPTGSWQIDARTEIASTQTATDPKSCTAKTCWKQDFIYAPAKSLKGNARDVLVTVSRSGYYNDIDLFVTDSKGKVLGSCSRPAADQNQVYLPAQVLRAGGRYTVVVRFITVLPKVSTSPPSLQPFFTQGSVQLPSPVHQPFATSPHVLDKCGAEGPLP